MKAKKIIPLLLICLLSFNLRSAIATENKIVKTEKTTDRANSKLAADVLIARLHQIQSMSKRDLSVQERYQLKKEVRGIKMELTKMEGGIYISASVLLIILLIILIL